MRIAIGSDHAGHVLRNDIGAYLRSSGHVVQDLGPEGSAAVDYPHYAQLVAAAVADGAAELGILVCGTGVGMGMVANRVTGVRAAVCTSAFMAEMARAHNDANVLCLGERVTNGEAALDMVRLFLETPFAGGRHLRRVEQIGQLDRAKR